MKRSPIALVLVAALGAGLALPSAPVLAQAGASMTVMPVRTGSSSIGGAFGVRLAVYDARSFELSWNRIPDAAAYRVQVGSRTVQENGAVSRYVSGVSLAGGFDYTLTALDRAGSTLATQRFRVQPASGTQLVAAGATTVPTNPMAPVQGPDRPRDTPAAPQDLRARLYSSNAGEVFWQRIPGALLSYEVRLGGSVVATTDGTSYFIGNRPGLAGTSVEVVAISRPTGRRSSASSVALGGGATSNPTTPTNPMAPVTPTTPATGAIRTGISNIGGDFPVRLAVYDAQSFELSWQRVPGAALYRLSRGGQVVQESNGLSRYVSGIDPSTDFRYTLFALDRSGTVLRSIGFEVSLRRETQLVPGSPGAFVSPTAPGLEGPIRIGSTSLGGAIPVRLAVYDARSYELFWERVPGAARYALILRGATVQESDATSYFTGAADATRALEYGLQALDRSGAVIRSTSFTVTLRGTPRLTTSVPGPAPVQPPSGPGNDGLAQLTLEQKFDVLSDEIGARSQSVFSAINARFMSGTLPQPVANCVDPATAFPILFYPTFVPQCQNQAGGAPSLAPFGFPARSVYLVDSPACRDAITEANDAGACQLETIFFTGGGYTAQVRPRSSADSNFDTILRATTNSADFNFQPGTPINQPGAQPIIDPVENSGCVIRYRVSSGEGIFLPSNEQRCNAVATELVRAIRAL